MKQASMYSTFWMFLERIKKMYRHGTLNCSEYRSELGRHGIMRGEDEEGPYIIVGCNLPKGVFAEIDSGTYGQLQGFRIYFDAEND